MALKRIPIRNIYYMLLYALKLLDDTEVSKHIDSQKFKNIPDLCAEILSLMISRQLKQGFKREYQNQSNVILPLSGKIEITESIKLGAFLRKRWICSWSDLSVNSYINRIVKTTADILIKSEQISEVRRINLKRLMTFFKDVKVLENIRRINWNIHYNKNDYIYKMLINYCRMVIEDLLPRHRNGKILLKDFFDEKRLNKLYEKFILGYYQQEFLNEVKAYSEQINWELDANNIGNGSMLPRMQTDITLEKGNSFLIIDAKYYEKIRQKRNEDSSEKFRSHNLYQIFSYVKNKNFKEQSKTVSGMLLYAKTDEELQENSTTYSMGGNVIEIRVLDLSQDFDQIKQQLNDIANKFIQEAKNS